MGTCEGTGVGDVADNWGWRWSPDQPVLTASDLSKVWLSIARGERETKETAQREAVEDTGLWAREEDLLEGEMTPAQFVNWWAIHAQDHQPSVGRVTPGHTPSCYGGHFARSTGTGGVNVVNVVEHGAEELDEGEINMGEDDVVLGEAQPEDDEGDRRPGMGQPMEILGLEEGVPQDGPEFSLPNGWVKQMEKQLDGIETLRNDWADFEVFEHQDEDQGGHWWREMGRAQRRD